MSRPTTGKATPERRYMLHVCHLHPPHPSHTTHYNNLNCLFIFCAPQPTVSSLAIQQHIKIYTKAQTYRRSLLLTRPLLTPFSNSPKQHTHAASETSTRETERQTLTKGHQYSSDTLLWTKMRTLGIYTVIM